MDWYLEVWRKYATFDGRARRKEYWMFILVNLVVAFCLGFIQAALRLPTSGSFGPLTAVYDLAVFLPSLAVAVRRLHDTGRSGWWILIGLVPLAGFIVLLVFYVQEGTPGRNPYGEDPKAGERRGPQAATPAGWFPDPTGRHQYRYWDSAHWTPHVANDGVASVDPL